MDGVTEIVGRKEICEELLVLNNAVLPPGEDLPKLELPDDTVQDHGRLLRSEMCAGHSDHWMTSSPSTVIGATLSMSAIRSSSSMVTSMAPRTGLLSANDTLPTVATSLFNDRRVVLPREFMIMTARVASNIFCLRIALENLSSVASPSRRPSFRTSSASGK